MMGVGYSGTPLIDKLGIKADMRVAILNAPDHYPALLGELPATVTLLKLVSVPSISDATMKLFNFIQLFAKERDELDLRFPILAEALAPSGMLWVSWPKKASKVPTSLTEDVVREIGLASGFVDVKVAAIDEVWSGLKFVRRLKNR
jgi:hypothetical protein